MVDPGGFVYTSICQTEGKYCRLIFFCMHHRALHIQDLDLSKRNPYFSHTHTHTNTHTFIHVHTETLKPCNYQHLIPGAEENLKEGKKKTDKQQQQKQHHTQKTYLTTPPYAIHCDKPLE